MKLLSAVALAAIIAIGLAGAGLFLFLLYELLAPLVMFIFQV